VNWLTLSSLLVLGDVGRDPIDDPDGMKDEEYEVVLLDKKIKIKISNKIEKEDRDKIKERLNAAIAKINAGADKLTTEEKKTINSMNGIELRTDISYSFTNTNNKVFNMMPSSVMVGSLDSLTGAIIPILTIQTKRDED
jgi:hypothetical protein